MCIPTNAHTDMQIHVHTEQDAYNLQLDSIEMIPDCRHPGLRTDSHTSLLYMSSWRKEYGQNQNMQPRNIETTFKVYCIDSSNTNSIRETDISMWLIGQH